MLSASIPATDLSMQLLNDLFGQSWSLVEVGQMTEISTLFFSMLGVVNACIMALGSGYIVYAVIHKCTGTASEGKMDSIYNMFWTPIRFGFGIFMGAPITSIGMSAGQVLLLWAVAHSIAGANVLWDHTLDYFEKGGMTNIIATPPPTLKHEFKDSAQVILTSSVVQGYASRKYKWKEGWGITSSYDYEKRAYKISFVLPEDSRATVSAEDLGAIYIAGSEDNPVSIARVNGLVQVYKTLEGAAWELARGTTPNPGYLLAAENAYNGQVMRVLQRAGEIYSDSSFMQKVRDFTGEGRKHGWFSAGSYTMRVARLQEMANEQLFTEPEIHEPAMDKIHRRFTDTSYDGFGRVLGVLQSSVANESINEYERPREFLGWVKDILTLRFAPRETVRYFADHDPFLALSHLGQTAMATASTLYIAGLVARSGAAAAEAVQEAVGKSWLTKSIGVLSLGGSTALRAGVAGAAAGFKEALIYMAPLLNTLCFLLLVAGAFAAFALPALPFFYWIFAAMEWVLLIVQALVAWPFWMLAHMISRDTGFAGEQGKQGYILALEILIRPMLLIIGLSFSFTAMTAIGMSIGKITMIFIDSTYYQDESLAATLASPVVSIGMVVLIIVLYWKILHMFFTQGVSHLPQTVTKWIGGSGSMTAAEQQAGDAHRTMAAAMGKVENSGLAAGRRAGKAASTKKAQNAMNETKEAGSGNHVQGQSGSAANDEGSWKKKTD
ncbi:MAG: hypothetical protein CL942_04205 [Desulfovibrio sp.]|nr:hypothetical protein [Desulfovibrio sp.]